MKDYSYNKRRAVSIIGNTLFILLCIALIVLIINVGMLKKEGKAATFFGYTLCYVQTGSMEPTIDTGGIILCKSPEDPNNIEVGTVVTFYDISGRIITHRIVEIVEGGYRTKGDNPINSPDVDVLTSDRIIGVLIKIF